MATTVVDGYEFRTTGSGRVVVTGPGITSPGGIDLGYASDLNAGAFTRAASGPNLTEAGKAALESLASSAQTIGSNLQAQSNAPIQSTGQTVTEAQQARDEGGLPQNPPVANDDAPPPSNADAAQTEPTTGTNSELRPIANTQSTPAAVAEPGAASPNNGELAYPNSVPGAGAASDDSGAGLNPVAQAVQQLYGKVESAAPRTNPLDRCATYTYNITLYLTTPELYSGLITNKKKSVSGMTVLMRSGGASQSPILDPQEAQQIADGAAPNLGAARNNNFPLDFYLDNLQIKSVINGKGTMSPHTATEINFRVIEPNGITFIHNLQAATKQLALGTGDVDNAYLSQIYLIAIRFYGWDENGNPVAPEPAVAAQQSDRTAVTEKFIPFRFTGIKFKIANRLTEYECSAIAVGNDLATGQQRGTVPYNFQITSSTLKDLLQKDLATALNKYQADLCKADPAKGRPEPILTYPDTYEFQLVPPLDGDSITIKPPGNTANSQTAMNPNAQQDPGSLRPAAQSVKSTTKLTSAFAGMSIVQFLDQMVRQSGYIYQQQTYITDPKTGKPERQSGAGNIFAWYRIAVQAVPDLQKWDPRRRDFAYKITYQITPYLVTDVLSDYFPQNSLLKGLNYRVPKEYYYWFTGQNNSIIDFTQEFNNLYYVVVNAPQPEISASQLKNESKKGYQPNSNISSAGMPGNVNEAGANAAQYLYSPADLARARMTIVGDPDWIQQGDVWAGLDAPDKFNASAIYTSGPDAGGINYAGRETLFDIIFKTPADYDLNTGLITDPSSTTPGPTVNGKPRMLEMRTRYKAIFVTNNFSQGKFTQDIEGVMVAPDVGSENKKVTQSENEKSIVAVGPGSPSLSGPEYTNFRKLEIAQQNASAKPTDWAQGYKDRLPTGARSDSMAAQLNASATNIDPLLSSAPTSGSEIVGPADPGATAVRSLGGAAGPAAVSQPSVNVNLLDGTTQIVTSQGEINSLLANQRISFGTASSATRALETQQQAANSPVSSGILQTGSRET